MLMKSKFLVLSIIFLYIIFCPLLSYADLPSMDTSAFKNEFIHKRELGLYTLGTWAVANMGIGAYKY